jgi:hypothetical protein
VIRRSELPGPRPDSANDTVSLPNESGINSIQHLFCSPPVEDARVWTVA